MCDWIGSDRTRSFFGGFCSVKAIFVLGFKR
jgi:hypothetical protein